ncbi:hypothetical protein GBAR_LOCUS31792 [Geodia barretti]|uniref:Uncharacterized protein n=1 Tax=Geodia barretti TaxID=519541 RepID=A0AA35U3D0_GEOBA|nr:hypothetical protein GBAR_LOCUS31792 [Geodia barretti]
MSSGTVKPRRVRSAKARLTPTQPPSGLLTKEALERQASAKANRDKHNGSEKVFPRPGSRSSKERFSTMYSKDFDGTYAPAAELRPTSPTRRHNPHPGKQFMVWRLPDREIGVPQEPEGLELPPEYITRNSDFDAIEDLHGGLGALKLPPPQPTSHEYGAYLRQQRQQREALQKQLLQPGVRSHAMGPEVLERTMREEMAPNLQEWMQAATPEEKHTILKMLKSAEDAQMDETINDVMQPSAAKAVRKWMKTADNKERQVAVHLFSSLGPRAGRPRSMSEPSIRPLSRQPLPPYLAPPPPLPGSARGQRLQSRQQASRGGSRGAQAPPPKPWPAGLWHHLPVRDPPPQVYHRGALFGGVRGDASHYNVHPEWPDYYGTSLGSDVVH